MCNTIKYVVKKINHTNLKREGVMSMASFSWIIGGIWYVLFFVRFGRLYDDGRLTVLRAMYDTVDFALIGSVFIVGGMILWQLDLMRNSIEGKK